jgi:hypothetical protein
MANSIALFKNYIPLLDEVYKDAALTSVLDGAADLAREGANANELIIPMLDMNGLADYDRNSGYVDGDVTLVHETVKCNFDRGRRFQVDNMDNAETAGIAFGRLSGEFIRTKVAPEIDAFRMAAYASTADIGTASGALTSGANVITALRTAVNAMDEAEVPQDQRYLFITPTLKGMIEDLDSTKSREVMAKFAQVIAIPQNRFFSEIAQNDGKTGGQEGGGYKKGADGKNINFMIVHKPAVIQFQKHIAPRVFDPSQNQDADAWRFTYRNVGIAQAYKNKVAGIYAHLAAN